MVKGLAGNPQGNVQRQRWLGYHCPFFADLSSVGRSRYRTSMYTSLSSRLTALSSASCRPISPLRTKKHPLYCAPSLTNSPILLSIALSSRPDIKPLAPASIVLSLSSRAQCPVHPQQFATLFFLDSKNSPESSSTFSRPNS